MRAVQCLVNAELRVGTLFASNENSATVGAQFNQISIVLRARIDQEISTSSENFFAIGTHGDAVMGVYAIGIQVPIDQDLAFGFGFLVKILLHPIKVTEVDLP